MLGPFQHSQFGTMQILRDFSKASLELRARLRKNRDLLYPEFDARL